MEDSNLCELFVFVVLLGMCETLSAVSGEDSYSPEAREIRDGHGLS
jgi:hypothetical protein